MIKQIFLQAEYYHPYLANELGKIPVCCLEFNSLNFLYVSWGTIALPRNSWHLKNGQQLF